MVEVLFYIRFDFRWESPKISRATDPTPISTGLVVEVSLSFSWVLEWKS